jgi:hypothetical protein
MLGGRVELTGAPGAIADALEAAYLSGAVDG